MRDEVPGTVLNEGGPWGGSGGSDGEDRKKRGQARPGAAGPSALDALLRRGRARFGGGGDGDGFEVPRLGGLWRWVLLALVVLWIGLTSTHTIGAHERGVVTRFGKYIATLDPGTRWTLPAPIDTVTKVDVDKTEYLDIAAGGDGQSGENLILTRDQNLINLAYSVRWSRRDAEQYMFELQNPEETIREVAESVMRDVVARQTFDQVMTGQKQIQQEVAERAQDLLDSYHAGVLIQGVTIKTAKAPDAVASAVSDVVVARQKVQASIQAAQNYASQITVKAQREAAQFDGFYIQYKAAPEVTRRRLYYETMERVLAKSDKVIVEPRNVVPYMVPPPAAPAATQEPAK